MPAYDIQDADFQGMSSSQLIVLYRQRGYSIREILGVMTIRHGKITSERSIVRVLRRYRLTRGQSQHSLEEIIQLLKEYYLSYQLPVKMLVTGKCVIDS
ncbi:hypothetical protein DPMN_107155 [Dreissena polymorpha]|uniref:Uncharacterized protein n=1 Tax=Dreissena polymorpha TaxID=45954 RepID=A0A9D4K6J8_DREPO|nr:hypothetical protein DPMN_107155 [Dreissena polymorpha]